MAAHQITDGTTTLTFISIRGFIPLPGEKTIVRQSSGVDGTGITRIGSKGTEGILRTLVDFDSAADAETARAAYKAFESSIVTVTDDRAVQHANIAVLEVASSEPIKLGASVGGLTSGLYLVRSEWRCMDVGS